MLEPTAAELQAFYQRIGRPPEQVFPIRFNAEAGLATGAVSGVVEGFYVLTKFAAPPKVMR